MHTSLTRIAAAFRSELSKWRTRGRFVLFLITPRGSGVGKGALQAALYFGIVGNVVIERIISENGLTLMLWAAELTSLYLIVWSAGYVFGGILTAQQHARKLGVEIERLKRRLEGPDIELANLTNRVDALESRANSTH